MKRFLLGVSLLALSASAALAQTQAPAQTTGQTMGQAQGDVPPYTAELGPRQGDFEVFLGGSGSSTDKFDSNSLGVSGSFGWYALKWLPLSLRQSYVTTFGDNVSDNHQLSTTGAVDFQAPLGRWQPFIGGFAGYEYGDHSNSVIAGPEAGIKVYVNESTFLSGLFQYRFLFDKKFEWDEGDALYTVGVGFNF